jgi:Glycosyltransferase family 87
MRLDILLFAIVASILISLNLFTLLLAFPETQRIDSGCCAPSDQLLAKDFSAYYTGTWRLYHDPSQIYTHGYVPDGEPEIRPVPEQYKYLPSFLLIASPVILVPYQVALTIFDAAQFLLLPIMAWLVYKLTREKGIAVSIAAAAIALLLPSPLPGTGASVSYFWQWAEGQAKVLETFLLLLSFYFGKIARPKASGVALGLASFDPRFALLAIPLFVIYNKRKSVGSAVGAAIACFFLTNLVFVIPGVLQGFVAMILSSGLATPFYYYSWIPLLTIAFLTIVELIPLFYGRGKLRLGLYDFAKIFQSGPQHIEENPTADKSDKSDQIPRLPNGYVETEKLDSSEEKENRSGGDQ